MHSEFRKIGMSSRGARHVDMAYEKLDIVTEAHLKKICLG